MSDVMFSLVLALFVSHELDAVHRHEWRLFPLLDRLEDQRGADIFILAHVPILWLIVWLGYGVPPAAEPTRIALSAFAVVHIWLHWLFRSHPRNEFGNPVSQALIRATGATGALYLIVWLIG